MREDCRDPRRIRGTGIRVAAVACAVISLSVAGCGSPTPSAVAANPRCSDLHGEIVGLAWSQRGAFLAVGTEGQGGAPGAFVVEAAGGTAGTSVVETEMVASSVVVSAEGRLAWLSERADGRVLTVDGEDGMIVAPLDGDIHGLAWTAIGYALLERTAEGSRVLLLDPDRPEAPGVLYRTELAVEHLWISADPEHLLLTVVHPDHRDAPASFEVVNSETSRRIEPPGADASGASMPSLRRQVVYRSATSGRMEAVSIDEPSAPVVLSSRAALKGAVSDAGVLAYADAEQPGMLCIEDVAAKLGLAQAP